MIGSLSRPLFLVLSSLVLMLGATSSQLRSEDVFRPVEGGSQIIRDRLATVFARYANDLLSSQLLNVAGMQVSMDLLIESARLNPAEPATWRKIILLALSTDQEELLEEATHNLLVHAPNDLKAQLSRLDAAIDQFNTADEMIAALEQLLSPQAIGSIGPELAARMSFRLADLHRRRGDIQEFSRWLGESIALDPTYSDAVGLATGFLKDRMPNRVAYTELLLELLTADLTDDQIMETLNMYLLDSGSYKAADRMVRMRLDQLDAAGAAAGSGIYAKMALAQWGNRKPDDAIQTITRRKQMLNNVYESLWKLENPSRAPMEPATAEAPLPPTLAAIQAILLRDAEDFIRQDAIEDLILSVNFEIGLSDMASESNSARVDRVLHNYWFMLWLDVDDALINTTFKDMESLKASLSDSALQRIEAWNLLRAGDPAAAAEMFKEDQSDHVMTQIGLAKCYLQMGHDRDAAEILLGIWNNSKNQISGLWARDELERLLGVELPMSEEAVLMEQAVDRLPDLFDRVPKDPRLALTMRLRPVSESYQAYEPILIEITITNNTPLPLAIDQDGPIQNLILLEGMVDVPYGGDTTGPGTIIELEEKLRLMPFQSLTNVVDLRRYWIGSYIDRYPLYGATINLTAMLNWRIETGPTTRKPAHLPGLMGIETELKDIRVDGQRVNEVWARRVIENLKGEDISPSELTDAVLLTFVIASNEGSLIAEPLPEEVIVSAIDTIIATYPRLDTVSQAWLLSMMKRSPRLEPLWEMGFNSVETMTKIIQLMRIMDSAREADNLESILDNADVISALNSPDHIVNGLAVWMEQTAQLVRDRRLERLTGEDGKDDE